MFTSLFRRWFPKPLTPAEQYVVDYLQQHGRLYGSRKWGPPTTTSDLDYCLSYQHYTVLYEHMKNCNLTYKHANAYANILSVDNHTKFVLSDGQQFDVITFQDWNTPRITWFNQTCDIMDSYCTNHTIPDKSTRHYYFEAALQVAMNEPCKSLSIGLHARQYFPELFI